MSALEIKRDKLLELVSELSSETDSLRRHQRKARNYEYRADPDKLPRLRDVGIQFDPETGELVKLPEGTETRQKGKRSPAKSPVRTRPLEEGSVGTLAETGKKEEAPEASQREIEHLEDYDPVEATRRELETIQSEVCSLRDESSALRESLERKQAELAKTETELKQIEMEDDIERQRREGARAIEEAKALLADLQKRKGYQERYEASLSHMLRRLREEKTDFHSIMQTFEESLNVQRNEVRLQSRHLDQVKRGLKKEEEELEKLTKFQKKQKEELEAKLVAHQFHVEQRKRQREEREKRLREERTLKARAEGDLTEKQEQELKARAAKIHSDVVTLAKRVRYASNKADDAEATFLRLRVAAGVPSAKGVRVKVHSEDPGYLEPDPSQILERYERMKEEVVEVDLQLEDMTNRLAHLRSVRDKLKVKTEPRAKSMDDETSVSREERVAYLKRIDAARRRLETVQSERDRLRRLQVQLGQTLDGLHKRACTARVKHDPVRYMAPAADGLSDWALDALTKVQDTEAKLVRVRELLDDIDEEDKDKEVDPIAEAHHLETTIESMVTQNECGIRIRPRKMEAARDEAFTAQDLTHAVHDLSSAAQRLARASAGPREGDESVGPSSSYPGGGGTATLHRESSAVEGKESRDGDSKERPAVRPLRTREIQRYLTAAITMAGGDVRDEPAPDGDSEEEETWEKIKRASEVEAQKHSKRGSKKHARR